MDFVTHAAAGALIGRLLAPADADRPSARRWALLGALVNLAPDVDHVLELVSAEAYLVHHRSATHSLLLVAIAIGAAAAIARARGGPPARVATVTAASLGVHLFLDLLTPFGTVMLWPFSRARTTLDGLPIVAPWLMLTMLAGAIAARRLGGRRAAGGGLGAALLVIAVYAAGGLRAGAAVPEAAIALPDALVPLAGEAFVIEEDVVVHHRVGIGGESVELERMPRARSGRDAALDRLIETSTRPLGCFRLPVVTSAPGEALTIEDGQFRGVSPRPLFRITSLTGGDGHDVSMPTPGLQVLLWASVVAAAIGAFVVGGRP